MIQLWYANPMLIRTLQRSHYKNCKVYFRQVGKHTFEYLAVINGEIYTAHVTILKAWWQYLLFQDYTEKQLTDICNYLARLSETTIEHVTQGK